MRLGFWLFFRQECVRRYSPTLAAIPTENSLKPRDRAPIEKESTFAAEEGPDTEAGIDTDRAGRRCSGSLVCWRLADGTPTMREGDACCHQSSVFHRITVPSPGPVAAISPEGENGNENGETCGVRSCSNCQSATRNPRSVSRSAVASNLPSGGEDGRCDSLFMSERRSKPFGWHIPQFNGSSNCDSKERSIR